MTEISENYSLQKLNTMQIDVRARFFMEIQSIEQLINALNSKDVQRPFYILGGGSNVVFLKDFEGTIFHINNLGKEIVKENKDFVWLKVNAGENWHELVLYALNHDFGGIENLSLIPGKVGASPMQNIGAYGAEIKDVFESLEAVEISSGKIKVFNKEDCKFGYRESVFKNDLKNQYIITSITVQLSKRNHVLKTSYGAIQDLLDKKGITNPSIQDISKAVIEIRESKLPNPKFIPNSGSFFKNPSISNVHYLNLKNKYPEIPGYLMENEKIKVPAGWLIEKSGWKGFRNSSVGVHEKQALVLINHNHASGLEIFNLSQEILDDVSKKFGIQLVREVNII